MKHKTRKKHNRNSILNILLYQVDSDLELAGYDFTIWKVVLVFVGFAMCIPNLVLFLQLSLKNLLFYVSFLILAVLPAINLITNFRHSRILCESLFILLAGCLSLILGQLFSACFLVFCFDAIRLTESYLTSAQNTKASSVLEILPDFAYVYRDGVMEKIKPSLIKKGDYIGIAVGDIVPVDGIIVEGFSTIDYSPLTRTNKTAALTKGAKVLSGGVNCSKKIIIQASCDYSECFCQSVYNSCSNSLKTDTDEGSKIELICRFYVPAFLLAALILGVFGPLVSHNWLKNVKKIIYLLILCCPYGIYNAVSLSTYTAVEKIFSSGAIIKSGNVLDKLFHAKTFICNKTSTVTENEYIIEDVNPVGIGIDNLLSLVTKVECNSKHPIAEALRNYCGMFEIEQPEGMIAEEIPGKGIVANINGNSILVGNANLLYENGIESKVPDKQGTVIHVAVNGSYCGYLVFLNKVRKGTFDAIESIKYSGIKHLALLSCDLQSVVRLFANSLGFTVTKAELSLNDKISVTDYFMNNKSGKNTIVYLGNGTDEKEASLHADVAVSTDMLDSEEALSFADVCILGGGLAGFAATLKAAIHSIRASLITVILYAVVKLFILIVLFANADLLGLCIAIQSVFAIVSLLLSTVFFEKV